MWNYAKNLHSPWTLFREVLHPGWGKFAQGEFLGEHTLETGSRVNVWCKWAFLSLQLAGPTSREYKSDLHHIWTWIFGNKENPTNEQRSPGSPRTLCTPSIRQHLHESLSANFFIVWAGERLQLQKEKTGCSACGWPLVENRTQHLFALRHAQQQCGPYSCTQNLQA